MQTQNNQRPASNTLCVCGDPDCIYSYQADRFDRHIKALEAIEARERGERPRKGYDLALGGAGPAPSWTRGARLDPRTVRLRR